MSQDRMASHTPDTSDEETNYSSRYQRRTMPDVQLPDLINTVKHLSDSMREMRQQLAQLNMAQNNGAIMSPSATASLSGQRILEPIRLSNNDSQLNEAFIENAEEQNPWLLPKNRNSVVLESALLGPNYNDQPLNHSAPRVSPKREPGTDHRVAFIDAPSLLDLEPSQYYEQRSGLGLNQNNLSDFLIEPKTRKAKTQNDVKNVSDNLGQPLTRESLCVLPTFDGSGNLKMFKQRFYEICQMNGWSTEKEITFWLKQCFRGRAKDILYDECSELSLIWSRLDSRFGDHLMLQRYSISLPNRKRQSNEPLTKLADDIRRMSDIVYFDLQYEQKERMAIMHFVSALQSPAIQYDISEKSPKTLEEALHIASIREMFFGIESQWGRPSTANQPNTIRQNNGSIHMPSSENRTNTPPAGQWPTPVPPTQNMAMPVPNMPAPVPNIPQTVPGMPQPGQWSNTQQNSWNAPGSAPQPMFPPAPWPNAPPPANMAYGGSNQTGQGAANQYRRGKCRHCQGDHPSFVCQPCRHCNGPHFDNRCPERLGKGNSQPISQ